MIVNVVVVLQNLCQLIIVFVLIITISTEDFNIHLFDRTNLFQEFLPILVI